MALLNEVAVIVVVVVRRRLQFMIIIEENADTILKVGDAIFIASVRDAAIFRFMLRLEL